MKPHLDIININILYIYVLKNANTRTHVYVVHMRGECVLQGEKRENEQRLKVAKNKKKKNVSLTRDVAVVELGEKGGSGSPDEKDGRALPEPVEKTDVVEIDGNGERKEGRKDR